jgi:hypothetical protein
MSTRSNEYILKGDGFEVPIIVAASSVRERHMIEYSTYLAFLLSPFLTPASGKIHMATTMKTAVIMM